MSAVTASPWPSASPASDGHHGGSHVVHTLAVGFADLCGFTRLSRSLPERDLVSLLERFEGAALLVLPAAGATVVKLLGDGVLFHADDVATAVDAASSLIEEARAGGGLPEVRAAITFGRVVVRGGDCFGESVNRASRLLDVAPPGTVVADDAAVVACDAGYPWLSLGQRPLRDYGPWPVWAAVA